jgi:hypothetical protein
MSIEKKKIQNCISDLRLYGHVDDSFYKGNMKEMDLPNIRFTTGINDTPNSINDVHMEICDENDILVSFEMPRCSVLYLYNFLKTYLELND